MERLRHIREQAGYSQQDLADESGVGQHTISEIELGRRKPQGRTLRKLAGVLGVEVRDFFEVEDARPLGQAPPETGPPSEARTVRLPTGVVSEETRRTPESMTVTRAGMAHPLDEILDDLEHGRVEEAKSKLRELIPA